MTGGYLLDSVAVVVQYNIIYHSLDFCQLGFQVFYLICAWLYKFFKKQIAKGNLCGIRGLLCSLNPGIFFFFFSTLYYIVIKILTAGVGTSMDSIVICCRDSSWLNGEAIGRTGLTFQRPAVWPLQWIPHANMSQVCPCWKPLYRPFLS